MNETFVIDNERKLVRDFVESEQKIRLYEPEKGDIFSISAEAINFQMLQLIYNGQLMPVAIEERKVRTRRYSKLFKRYVRRIFKKKMTYITLEYIGGQNG